MDSSQTELKSPTGIHGLDRITRGGLPRGRVTVVSGGAGSGKTVLSLQTLAHGSRALQEPGIFVAFEESVDRLRANARSFGWGLDELPPEQLFFLDARPDPSAIVSGDFDLGGLLAALKAQVQAMGAKRIVFDALDTTLILLGSPSAVRREAFRLADWLNATDLTAIITVKSTPALDETLDFLQFMADCVVHMNHDILEGYSHRSLRVQKYRGSIFSEDERPFLISPHGIEVAEISSRHHEIEASTERLSSGVAQLDAMLGGGYLRGSSILITGCPGTAKTTLAGCFTSAACLRGERTVFFSFDSSAREIERNLRSVGLDLAALVRDGLLRIVSARAIDCSSEAHLLNIKRAIEQHGAVNAVIDPISALTKGAPPTQAHSVAERLMDWCKGRGISLLCTSLLDTVEPSQESTPLQVSTIADTWIHLAYQAQSGERNRSLSIVKSRGTGHSNQVRELLLSSAGLHLTEVYIAGGEVLMGTLRLERERQVRRETEERRREAQRQREILESEVAELGAHIALLQQQQRAKSVQTSLLSEYQLALDSEQQSGAEATRVQRQKNESPVPGLHD